MENIKLIQINTNNPDPNTLKEVLAGIEEEGLFPGFAEEKNEMDAVTLAFHAASMSSLGVGIGIHGTKVQLAVKENLAPTLMPLENLNPRLIGQNGARFIKMKKLIL